MIGLKQIYRWSPVFVCNVKLHIDTLLVLVEFRSARNKENLIMILMLENLLLLLLLPLI